MPHVTVKHFPAPLDDERRARLAARITEALREAFGVEGDEDVERLWDEIAGGWFSTTGDDPTVLLRMKEDYDGAEPAPGSVAALNLLRLAGMLHDDSLRTRGRAACEALRGQWGRAPQALPQLLCALELALELPRQIIFAGDPAAEKFRILAAVVHEQAGPRRMLLAITGKADRAWLGARAPWLAEVKVPANLDRKNPVEVLTAF